MATRLIESEGIWPNGLTIIRIITGILLIFHGCQMFYAEDMTGYGQWLTDIGVPFALQAAYGGKVVEFIGGISFVIGLGTRLSSVLLFLTFLFITLVMGKARIFTDAQHPFLFALLSLVIFFAGSGKWSLDNYLKSKLTWQQHHQ